MLYKITKITVILLISLITSGFTKNIFKYTNPALRNIISIPNDKGQIKQLVDKKTIENIKDGFRETCTLQSIQPRGGDPLRPTRPNPIR